MLRRTARAAISIAPVGMRTRWRELGALKTVTDLPAKRFSAPD
jgi:hypothetical protein